MRRQTIFRRFLQAAMMLLIAGAFLGMLWWSGNQAPAENTPRDWFWEVRPLEMELELAEKALAGDDQAEAVSHVAAARERCRKIRMMVEADHAAWLADR